MHQKRFAIVCAAGIGDALITSIAAHHLRKQGAKATLFSPHLQNFGHWLEEGEYLPYAEDWAEALGSFDAVLLQHDNTLRARSILKLRDLGMPVYVLYTNYRLSKHGPLLQGFDFPFDESRPMVENTQAAIQELFGIEASKRCSLSPPAYLSHRKYPKRVFIHPTSTSEDKNWPKERFFQLAKKLEKRDFETLFILSPTDRASFPADIPAPLFETLGALADALYESGAFIGNDSGPAHLASYFSIPLAVICQGRQMPLWSPGWHSPLLIRPPRWVPNIKGMRLRENKWKHFITTKVVLKKFLKTLNQNRKTL